MEGQVPVRDAAYLGVQHEEEHGPAQGGGGGLAARGEQVQDDDGQLLLREPWPAASHFNQVFVNQVSWVRLI